MKYVYLGALWLLPLSAALAQGVGIGTTQPDRPLAIQAPSGGYELLSLKNNTGATQWHLNLYYGGLNFVETNVADYRLLLQTGGNVGIGTGAPSQKVEVAGGSVFVNSENVGYLIDSQPNARVGLLKYGGREGGIWRLSSQKFEIGRVDTSVTALPGSPSAWTTDLYVSGTGRVGVGTTSPGAQLEVALPSATANYSLKLEHHGSNLVVRPLAAGSSASIIENTGGNLLLNPGGGNIGINQTNPQYALDVRGDIYASGGVHAMSDARFKQQVQPLAGALAAVQRLRGVRYQWNALGIAHGGQASAAQIGLLAQELEQVYPELVSTSAQGYKAVNYAQLTPVLLEAIKELAARNAALENQVQALQADHADLQTLKQQLLQLQAALAPGEQAQAQR